MRSEQTDLVRVTRSGASDTVIAGTFAVARRVLFDAITGADHLPHWMSAAGMTLAKVEVDPRPGGSFCYVYQRPSGRTIEVRGAYREFDPPRGVAYVETYDFSPLRIEVTTSLEEEGGRTRFTQTLHYATAQERDEDFDPVATSSREAYARLGRYLKNLST